MCIINFITDILMLKQLFFNAEQSCFNMKRTESMNCKQLLMP